MMIDTLPPSAEQILDWSWPDIEPFYRDLEARSLRAESVGDFLADWSRVKEIVEELSARLEVAITRNTADREAQARFERFLETTFPAVSQAEQRLTCKLLDSGLEPPGLEVPMRGMRADSSLFRDSNLPLLVEEQKLVQRYHEIVGVQTVTWDGIEIPVTQLQPVLAVSNRDERERAWRTMIGRQLEDRTAIDELWTRLLITRVHIASNADCPDVRAYYWERLHRFDYSPQAAQAFHVAVEQEVVPALHRLLEQRRTAMGLRTLRPWDLDVDPCGRPPLQPFTDVAELEARASTIFHHMGRRFGNHFDTLIRDGLLDLETRANKAPGGYCETFAASHVPFIFMNATGIHEDVQTLLHEAGHAFHVFETRHLPYVHQRETGMEFAEVASMAMELLAAPYLAHRHGGFYTDVEAARARVDHLERMLFLWVTVAATDAFQHWLYEHPSDAEDPRVLDRQWLRLHERYIPGVDWSGLETERMTGWHRILHIHVVPFYVIEYGLAQLGAVQIWSNAREDQSQAVSRYRRALALGGTRSLPELFAAAGASFIFDREALRRAVQELESARLELEGVT